MNNKLKLGAAVLAAFALTLGSAGVAFASKTTAETGSNGPVTLISGDDGSIIPEGTTLQWDDPVLAAADPNNLAATFPGDASATTAKFFVAPRGSERTVSAWKASGDSGFKPGTKEIKTPPVSLGQLLYGDWAGLKANGGDFSLGVADLNNNGLTVAGGVAYYVWIHVNAGGTWKFENTTAVVVPPTITAPTEPTDAANTATKTLTITTTAGNSKIHIGAVAGHANDTVRGYFFSTAVPTGQITLTPSGVDVETAGLGLAPGSSHKFVLAQDNGTVIAWNTFTVPASSTSFDTNLTADVTVSEKFQLVAPASTTVNLGSIRRNYTTAPVGLGQFKVIDDRSAQTGWVLNQSALAFAHAGDSYTVPNSALGVAPVASGLPANIHTDAAQIAGSAAYGSTFAHGDAGSSTGEDGVNFDASLTFKAPVDAKVGHYTSVYTLTLVAN
jgi:hypothetical protein